MDDINAFFFRKPLETNFFGHIFSEIYKEGAYVDLLEGRKDLTILDIGANVGITSYYFSQFAKQVYSLEPSSEHFELLSKMVDFNKLTNVKPINKALFTDNGKFPFGGPDVNRTMRSLHMAVWQDGKPIEEVETITLEKLFEDEKIDHVDFMKLDIEGSEIEVVSHETFRKVADKIDAMLIESHSWSGRNQNQLVEALRKSGFKVKTLETDAQILVATK